MPSKSTGIATMKTKVSASLEFIVERKLVISKEIMSREYIVLKPNTVTIIGVWLLIERKPVSKARNEHNTRTVRAAVFFIFKLVCIFWDAKRRTSIQSFIKIDGIGERPENINISTCGKAPLTIKRNTSKNNDQEKINWVIL